jgi:putative transposase
LQVDARGIPLSLVVTGANRHDVSQLAALLDARVLSPLPDEDGELSEENLCADAGYAGEPAEQVIRAHDYVPHVRSRADEKAAKKKNPNYRPRRWVVEVSHAWFNRFRKLLVRYEKTLASSLALHHLAAAIIAFRKVIFMYGPYGK